NKFGSKPMLERWAWWKAAASMALERPMLGWGPGSFAQALRRVSPGAPAAGDPRNLLAQCAAEWGVPATALWLFGVLRAVAKGRSAKRLGALAFLVQSMWSGSFAAPAGLWLLSYFAASSVPETGRGVNVPLRWKPALCAASLGGGAGLAWAAARGLVLAWR
ncbi:MAG TPA: O-antigen ligase family protein, partial [Elusimicrobiota bacterium]|nr:O-antigen ligase family protein [Elusimicrobiota bacterium]